MNWPACCDIGTKGILLGVDIGIIGITICVLGINLGINVYVVVVLVDVELGTPRRVPPRRLLVLALAVLVYSVVVVLPLDSSARSFIALANTSSDSKSPIFS